MQDFEAAIEALDLTLFSQIESQSTDSDKRSMLAIQAAVRELRDPYIYLEVGSYLGGSIQPYLLDPKCRRIVSIDKRPAVQNDARGYDWRYANNSTKRMLENLRGVDEHSVGKVFTIDSGTETIDPAEVGDAPQICMIDGEHTDAAMRNDFLFCRKVLEKSGGAIVFHDAQITYNGIYECVQDLKEEGVEFRAYVLPSVVFVIELGDMTLHRHPAISRMLINNHEGYLFGLRDNDRYRRFANRFPFRQMRNAYIRLRNDNVSF
jgi:hypothetical protein